MATVEIEYCVPCGYLERAEQIEHALLVEFGQELDAVTLKTGDHGVLTVTVEGETVFDKDEDDYDVQAILDDVQDHVTTMV